MDISNFQLRAPEIPFVQLRRFNSAWVNSFNQIIGLMTDELIWHIAEADYGCEKEVCYKELKNIITTLKFPTKPSFILIECLELTRWTYPENRNDHILTAFSAMLLLILEEETDYAPDCENETLIVFIDSAINLQIDFQHIQELIIWKINSDYRLEKEWCVKNREPIEDITIDVFFIYALLLMTIFGEQNEGAIGSIADWLLNMDKFNKNLPPFYSKEREDYWRKFNISINPEQFLLGSTFHNQRNFLWKEKSKEILKKIKYIESEELKLKLKNIANKILMEKI